MCALEPKKSNWFAVVTKYKCEKSVMKSLSLKGVEAYVPIQEVVRIHGTRKRKLSLPVISCYAFVKITSKEYVKVLETENVIRFVSFKKDIVAIPENEIDTLRRITGELKTPIVAEPITYKRGDAVEIVSGELTGLKGHLVSIDGKRAFTIELKNMGFSLHLQVEPKFLRRVAQA